MWAPQAGPQLHLIEADWCNEAFFGGARGGGKTDCLLGDYLQDVNKYGVAWKGIFFRRTYSELEPAIARAKELYIPMGAEWRAGSKTFTFPSGATIKFRFLQTLEDADNYQGHEYTWIGIDEAGNWDDERKLNKLRATLRSSAHVPTKRIRLSGNPGGKGATWIKPRYIDPSPLGYIPLKDEDSGLERIFIPSKVTDNKILLENDPDYVNRLKQLGSPELVRMWLDGDWDAELGQYFAGVDDVVIRPFDIPESWSIIRGFDWGYDKPFSVIWAAIADGTQPFAVNRYIPRGAMVVFREWYGASAPNKGLRMNCENIAKGIIEREADLKNYNFIYSVADTACFNASTGVSLAEQLAIGGVTFRKSDKNRVSGWQQIRNRITGTNGFPMIYLFETARDLIRTLKALKHDDKKPEDADTDLEDHAPDALRYMAMSRPWSPPVPQAKKRREPTINELLEDFDRRRGWEG